MTSEPAADDPSRERFEYFSNEYAQALQALQAIEKQSSTLLLLGGSADLRTFVDQFLEMAERTRQQAVEKQEENFANWFAELIERAQSLRAAIPQQ